MAPSTPTPQPCAGRSLTTPTRVAPWATGARPLAWTLALLLWMGCMWPGLARATGAQACPQVDARVTGAAPADLGDICQGVATAAAFLAGHGVFPTETLTITVKHQLPDGAGPSAVGCYIERDRRAYLVPYAAFRAHKTWFGVPITREMYQALASHEAAHAIVACNFKIPQPSIQAKEYLAYAAMLSGMDSRLRNKVLSKMKPTGFSSLERFTPLLYLFDPMRFGAEAYQHFSTATDPTGLVDTILTGAALTD